jgi:hypothetical protein
MNVRDLEPGTVVHFDDFNQIGTFEDEIAIELDPEMDGDIKHAWYTRQSLKSLVRPNGFNGTITTPQLVVIDTPFNRYIDAKARGLTFNKGGYTIPKNNATEEEKDSYLGYVFIANALSTAHSSRQIHAEIWYTSQGLLKYSRKQLENRGDCTVRRIVSRPTLESIDYFVPTDTARQIGFSALINA